MFMRLGETKKSSWITSLRSRRDSHQFETIYLSRKNTHQPPKKRQAKSLLTLMNYPHFLRRMTLWRAGGGSARDFSGAARTPSPPQDPDLAEIDTEPDGAAVDGGGVDVGRSNHGVGEADTRSKSVGAGRPVHGVKEASVSSRPNSWPVDTQISI